MDHQPYKTWIVLNTPLDLIREEELSAHLSECSSCQELQDTQRDLQQMLLHSRAPGPKPGFSRRWLVRIEAREKRERNRLSWILLSGILLSLFSVLTAVGYQLRAQLPSISEGLIFAVHQAARWLYYFNHLWDLAEPLLSISLKVIPRTWLASGLVALTAFLIVPLLQVFKYIFSSEETVR